MKNTTKTRRWVSIKQAEQLTSYSRWTIYRAIKAGTLRATKPGGKGRYRISENDLTDWIQQEEPAYTY